MKWDENVSCGSLCYMTRDGCPPSWHFAMRAQRFEYQQFIFLCLPFVGTIHYWNPTGKGMQRHAVMVKDMLVRALLMTAQNKEKARWCMTLMEGRRRRDTGIRQSLH
ncbi:hypothetical protein PGQ11_002660 [Apiospora arundinis]|uniref:Uncharacterized protein n=1 Tax=Apiospora arundinis TaxID=335852 RepID=A0ABR2JIS8_9PEZI